MSLVIDEHREYLSDRARMSAFTQAIGEIVRPGDVVLDLGAGTGILGLLACQAGASRVYAIDEGGMIEVARRVCRANGLQDRVTFIKNVSLHADLPERVDVIVADQIGRFGFDAGILEYFVDGRERFLKPGGRLIPARVSLWVAPVEAPALSDQVDFWSSAPAGFDFRSVREWAVNTGYPARYSPDQLLAEPRIGRTLDLATATTAPFAFRVTTRVTRPGTLHGIAGWFSADLSLRVPMSNSPLIPDPINRRNVFFPVDRPVPVEVDDVVAIQMHVAPLDTLVTWKVDIANKASFVHSTWKGMLVSREQLAKTAPAFVPTLTRRGAARASVLELCNGRNALARIEDEMLGRFPDLFGTREQASVFVTEVIAVYAV